MKKLIIKHFDDNREQLKWLHDNREEIKAQRQAMIKEADGFSFMSFAVDEKGERLKAEDIPVDTTKLKIRAIINTTGLFDSHKDVHIPGIWKKSLSESKIFYLVNQHAFNYDGILTDDVKASVQTYTWAELGFKKIEGETQALVFDAVMDLDSPYMKDSPENRKIFYLYRAGKVRNHSVGMRYVKDFFCINSDSYPDEKENWDKYYKYVANKEEADNYNYFFAVTEAKIIEGSAVVRGSNWVTPTLTTEEVKNIPIEADKSITSEDEPSKTDTQTKKQNIFIKI